MVLDTKMVGAERLRESEIREAIAVPVSGLVCADQRPQVAAEPRGRPLSLGDWRRFSRQQRLAWLRTNLQIRTDDEGKWLDQIETQLEKDSPWTI